jgi:hypothetical protein
LQVQRAAAALGFSSSDSKRGAPPQALECVQNGSPFKVQTIDMDTIDEKHEEYCYTFEEAQAKYGPTEGREYGDKFKICGELLPQKRAVKFMKFYGPKVAQAFAKLSYEERYSVMIGSLKFPDEFLRESMSEYWRGSKGKKCDSCQDTPEGTSPHRFCELHANCYADFSTTAHTIDIKLCAGEQKFDVCGRCDYTACVKCRLDKKLGTCFCRDENFGIPYPRNRKFYQKGLW